MPWNVKICCFQWKYTWAMETNPTKLLPLQTSPAWVLIYNKSMSPCQDSHRGFHLRIYRLPLVRQVHTPVKYPGPCHLLTSYFCCEMKGNWNFKLLHLLANPVSQKLHLFTLKILCQIHCRGGVISIWIIFTSNKSRKCICLPHVVERWTRKVVAWQRDVLLCVF